MRCMSPPCSFTDGTDLRIIQIYGGGLQITDRYGVIRILPIIRIYRVQILKYASLTSGQG